jgi:hypothetical protein
MVAALSGRGEQAARCDPWVGQVVGGFQHVEVVEDG